VFLLLNEGLVIRMVRICARARVLLNASRITLAGVITRRELRGTLETPLNRIEKAGGRNLVQPQTYEITFLGQAGTTLRAEFEDCEVIIGRGTTTLRTELPDSGALSGLMERINGLGLDVIDVSLVASPPRR
jgi:hypothetical protein